MQTDHGDWIDDEANRAEVRDLLERDAREDRAARGGTAFARRRSETALALRELRWRREGR